MIVCLFAIGACLRHHAFVSFMFFSLYMVLAMSKRHLFLFTNYSSLYSLYIGPSVDPLLFSAIVNVERFITYVGGKVVEIIKNI